MNNGHASFFDHLQRGVRQGCPLSGLPFIIGIKLFIRTLEKVHSIKRINVERKEIKIMQYADDTTVFLTFRIERSYENCKIYCNSQDYIDRIYEIYWKDCKEGFCKVTRIAKITKLTKTAKFTEIRETTDKLYEYLFKGLQRRPHPSYKNCQNYDNFRKLQNLLYFARPTTKSTIFIHWLARKAPPKLRKLHKSTKLTKTRKMYCNSQVHRQNLRNLLKGLQGRLLQSDENFLKLENLR